MGSKIILTSRDKKLLIERAYNIYEIDALGFGEVLKLFYQNVFSTDSSYKIEDYINLSKRIVDYAGDNPLAFLIFTLVPENGKVH